MVRAPPRSRYTVRCFGFSTDAAADLRSPYAGSPAFMALALEENAFDGPMSVAYPEAFSGV